MRGRDRQVASQFGHPLLASPGGRRVRGSRHHRRNSSRVSRRWRDPAPHAGRASARTCSPKLQWLGVPPGTAALRALDAVDVPLRRSCFTVLSRWIGARDTHGLDEASSAPGRQRSLRTLPTALSKDGIRCPRRSPDTAPTARRFHVLARPGGSPRTPRRSGQAVLAGPPRSRVTAGPRGTLTWGQIADPLRIGHLATRSRRADARPARHCRDGARQSPRGRQRTRPPDPSGRGQRDTLGTAERVEALHEDFSPARMSASQYAVACRGVPAGQSPRSAHQGVAHARNAATSDGRKSPSAELVFTATKSCRTYGSHLRLASGSHRPRRTGTQFGVISVSKHRRRRR